MVYADDVDLIVPLLAFLHGVVTDEGAVGGRCEEEGTQDAGSDHLESVKFLELKSRLKRRQE